MNYLIKNTVKIGLLMLFLVAALDSYASENSASVNFTSESFEIAKERAEKEGKLFFVDFYANWCTPCKWMEKTTFQDREVIKSLNNNYVAIKVDIDTKEGYDIKEKYQIRVLPTLLIFNTDGEMVERVQETLSRSKLVNLLDFHVQSDTKVLKTNYFNQSPNGQVITSPQSAPNNATAYGEPTAKKDTYRIQIGDYDNYTEALTKVNDIREEFLEDIIVLNEFREGKVWYKVLMGKFGSFTEAESFRIILERDFQIPSNVY